MNVLQRRLFPSRPDGRANDIERVLGSSASVKGSSISVSALEASYRPDKGVLTVAALFKNNSKTPWPFELGVWELQTVDPPFLVSIRARDSVQLSESMTLHLLGGHSAEESIAFEIGDLSGEFFVVHTPAEELVYEVVDRSRIVWKLRVERPGVQTSHPLDEVSLDV